jgi:hypothetical protein
MPSPRNGDHLLGDVDPDRGRAAQSWCGGDRPGAGSDVQHVLGWVDASRV